MSGISNSRWHTRCNRTVAGEKDKDYIFVALDALIRDFKNKQAYKQKIIFCIKAYIFIFTFITFKS